ncbi:hypothetical protein [Bradyrhizobium sp. USDA 10063]
MNDVPDFGATFVDDVPLRKRVVSEPVTRNDDFVSVNGFNRCWFPYPVVGRPANLQDNRVAKRQLWHIPLPPIFLPAGLVSSQPMIEQAKWPSHGSIPVLPRVDRCRQGMTSSLRAESSHSNVKQLSAVIVRLDRTIQYSRGVRA